MQRHLGPVRTLVVSLLLQMGAHAAGSSELSALADGWQMHSTVQMDSYGQQLLSHAQAT